MRNTHTHKPRLLNYVMIRINRRIVCPGVYSCLRERSAFETRAKKEGMDHFCFVC